MKNYSGYQEFHLSIMPVGENQYLLRTERVAPGVSLAEQLVVWPIEIWLNQAAIDPLLPTENDTGMEVVPDWVCLYYRWQESSSATTPPGNFSSASSLTIELAQQIYNVLFQGNIRTSWLAAREMARIRGEILQVRLIIKDKRLADLPWELVSIGEFLRKEHFCPAENRLTEEGLDGYFDEFDASDAQDWEMEAGDLNDSEDEEDSAFISGLLTQLSQPNLEISSSNETVSPPRSLDRNPTPANAVENPTNDKTPSHRISRNFISLFDRQNLTLPNKQLLLLSLAFLFFTASSWLIARNRWLGWESVNYLPSVSTPTPTAKALSKTPSIEVNKLSNAKLAEIAVKNFRQGELRSGQEMVETLLNRNALPQAKIALAAISPNQKNNSAIDFLYGRLAWQAIKSGDKNYTLDEVQRYWENALKGEPTSPLYHNALGFVYYARGNMTKANHAWFEGLYHAQEEQVAKTESEGRQNLLPTPIPTQVISSQDVLTAYAGLSLVLWKSSENQPADKRSRLMAKAIELSQKVMQDAPDKFQAESLQDNWLWTKQEIQDWQKLQQIKGRGNRGSKNP